MDKELLASIRRGEAVSSGGARVMPGGRGSGGSSSSGSRF
jgi:hypothetical protein